MFEAAKLSCWKYLPICINFPATCWEVKLFSNMMRQNSHIQSRTAVLWQNSLKQCVKFWHFIFLLASLFVYVAFLTISFQRRIFKLKNKAKLRSLQRIVTLLWAQQVQYATAKIYKHLWHESANFNPTKNLQQCWGCKWYQLYTVYLSIYL